MIARKEKILATVGIATLLVLSTLQSSSMLALVFVGTETTNGQAVIVGNDITLGNYTEAADRTPNNSSQSSSSFLIGNDFRHEPLEQKIAGKADNRVGTTSKGTSDSGSRSIDPEHASQGATGKIEANEYCFVTANFGEKADNMTRIAESMLRFPMRHFVFTENPNMDTGWRESILLPDNVTSHFSFKRMITWSRWPKFMGWSHPKLASCKYVYYYDARMRPREDVSLEEWDHLGELSNRSNAGVLQDERPYLKLIKELEQIVKNKKDIEENVNKTINWMRSQPDFDNHCTAYWNMAFIYNPRNPHYQNLTTSFWEKYSQEDGSWRDQPYYRYFVRKFRMTPAKFPRRANVTTKVKHGFHRLYFVDSVHPTHAYGIEDDSNAIGLATANS